MSQGSGYPSVKDTTANFLPPTTAATKFNSNLPNEMAAAMEAAQITCGADPLDLTDIAQGSFADIATMLLKLCRVEVGTSANFANGDKKKTITTTSGRFTDLDSVMIMLSPEGQYQPASSSDSIESFTIYNLRTLTSGNFTFDIYRRLPATHNDVVVKWIVIEWA